MDSQQTVGMILVAIGTLPLVCDFLRRLIR